MWTLARKNLLKEKARLAISIGGVAFAVVLMVLLRGLYVAYETKVSDYYNAMDVDAWVLQEGCADLIFSYSVLPLTIRSDLENLDGVAEVVPYTARQIGFDLNGRDVVLYLVAFNPNRAGPGPGPVAMSAGTSAINADEIIIDRVFARKNNVEIGEVLSINGKDLRVAGISSGGDMVVFQYGFVTRKRARSLLHTERSVTSYLLRYTPDASATSVADGVASMEATATVKSVGDVVKANQRVINEGFLPVLGVLLVIGFCIGVAVIGLTIYSAVLEHRREYGVLKAVGARTRQMLLVVTVQALCSAVAGYVVGIGISLLVARAAERWVPQFVTHIQPLDVGIVGLAALLMGLVASVVPLHRIARVDPAVVFRA
ncbi:MAG: ABC transporter permease [Thermoleophilia bacterium]